MTAPAATRVLLGRELKALRIQAGVDRSAVLAALGWDSSKLSRIDVGAATPTVKEVDQLLTLFDVEPEKAAGIRALATQARRRSRFGRVPDWSRQYFGLEQDASRLDFYRSELIPGLFQTEAYARASISTSVVVPRSEVDQVVKTRIARQKLLTKQDAPRIHLILGEAALKRRIGGEQVHREQMTHLAKLAELPNVVLQVFPFPVGAHAALGTDFTLLTVDIGGQDSRWVYLEDLTRGECRSEERHVSVYQLTFDSLVANALGEAETIRLLSRSRDGISED